jgi:hypothetical protein
MGVTMAGATTDGLAGSWLEGAGTQGLSLRISWFLQPPAKLRAPIAIVEMTATPKTLMRLLFTLKSPVCYA